MSEKNKPEERVGMTEEERQEHMRRVNEFWWGKRPAPKQEEPPKRNK
ncbi:hypothetical protein [Bacillus badius]|uniref:Uncharacterized protein n=1 Tax=Bacillus badius TaxID=1455 RepID=A0ABR5B1D2_BACBA|nr:hypothetical protein [Bacillus badius]KIL72603.1 hypothetical protein SD78_4188 [Bacillus badius]KIL80792.1 hypothetical protein SD77_0640 [Bacillus badius]MED0667458.1 hypothetical protein [Bacillus badius]MED4715284.1 hypothetical protein [Bacillus badius]TDW06090.1 hypothetical protein B0G66_101524 [Bacillus badius]